MPEIPRSFWTTTYAAAAGSETRHKIDDALDMAMAVNRKKAAALLSKGWRLHIVAVEIVPHFPQEKFACVTVVVEVTPP